MPTPSGKPKKGDRVKLQMRIFNEVGPARYGRPGVCMMVDAAYALQQGWLTFV